MNWRLSPIVFGAVVAVLVPACGASDNGGAVTNNGAPRPSFALSPGALRSRLPPAIISTGVLRVGLPSDNAPFAEFSHGQPGGLDFDLANALARPLGIPVSFQADRVDPTDLSSGAVDLIMSGLADTGRARARGVDFVDYLQSTFSLVSLKTGSPLMASLDAYCGRTIAFVTTSASAEVVPSLASKCESRHSPPPMLQSVPTRNEVVSLLRSGRASAAIQDTLEARYAADTSTPPSELAIASGPFSSVTYGIAVGRDNAGLRDDLAMALRSIESDGTYDRVLSRWGAPDLALKTASINSGTG